MSSRYAVQIEVAGPLAMFTRPDSGGAPTSYPAPTWSASKGILESIAFFSDGGATFHPTKVEVCRPTGSKGGKLTYQRYTTNYGGPLRKKDLFRKGNVSGGSSMQLFATVLQDVCYRIHADIVGVRQGNGRNSRHHLQDLFNRRLRRGQCFRTPCLGWSEFTCSYWGPPRKEVMEVDEDFNCEIPSMLVSVWNSPSTGSYAPTFAQDTRVEAGVLRYESPELINDQNQE